MLELTPRATSSSQSRVSIVSSVCSASNRVAIETSFCLVDVAEYIGILSIQSVCTLMRVADGNRLTMRQKKVSEELTVLKVGFAISLFFGMELEGRCDP
jgi:hypothetical protein